jgi:putative hydrolase of the HAD superfamily
VIRAVFFDLDGTLYDRDAAIVRVAQMQFERFKANFPHLTQSTFVEQVVALDKHGHSRPMGFHQRLAEALGVAPQIGDELEACFRDNYPSVCRITEDTVATLRTLRSRGLKLGIITNGPTVWQRRKIDALGIAPLFDTIVISGSEGLRSRTRASLRSRWNDAGLLPSSRCSSGIIRTRTFVDRRMRD